MLNMGIDDAAANTSGQSSSKQNESTSERPFKKAKYAWQVKGRSHLKGDTPSSTNTLQQTDYHLAEKERVEKEQYLAELRQIKDEPYHRHCVRGHSFCYGCDYINRLLQNSEQFMGEDDDDTDIDTDDDTDYGIGTKRKWCHSNSMVPKPQRRYDYLLAKWQSRQLAKSYVDNTINAALERWMISPYEEATDLIENSENDGFVEDEGILMAIQSHGLQSQIFNKQEGDSKCPHVLPRSSSSLPYTNKCTCNTSSTKVHHHFNHPLFPEQQQPHVPECKPSEEPEEEAEGEADVRIDELETRSESTSSLNMDDPWEFLSAAVGVAIQEKGLKNV